VITDLGWSLVGIPVTIISSEYLVLGGDQVENAILDDAGVWVFDSTTTRECSGNSS